MPPGALHEPSLALGRVTRQEIYPDETMLDAKMYPQGQDFSTVLPVPKGNIFTVAARFNKAELLKESGLDQLLTEAEKEADQPKPPESPLGHLLDGKRAQQQGSGVKGQAAGSGGRG